MLNNEINGEIIVLDWSGFSNGCADKYYAIIRRKERKNYVKNHISIDVGSKLIFHFGFQSGSRFDTHFAITVIRNIKKYNLKYILKDSVNGAEFIRKYIN